MGDSPVHRLPRRTKVALGLGALALAPVALLGSTVGAVGFALAGIALLWDATKDLLGRSTESLETHHAHQARFAMVIAVATVGAAILGLLVLLGIVKSEFGRVGGAAAAWAVALLGAEFIRHAFQQIRRERAAADKDR